MVAGVEKYFQIARCFRDEDLRADRQPEFTQVDVEGSFVNPDEDDRADRGIASSRCSRPAAAIDIPTPFERVTWHDAMDKYGSDKPERRFEMHITDLSDLFKESGFKVFSGAVKPTAGS